MAFDFDGTLADTFPWFCGVIDGVAARYRFRRIEAHETEALRGLDARAIIRRLGIPAWRLPFITRHMHGLAARDIAGIALFPGVPEMLADLERMGAELAIVSSNTEANVRRALGPDAARIRRMACGASLFGKAKRLRAVMRSAGCGTGDVLYVGDEIRDHEAAAEVGCAFGAVAWGYTRADVLAARRPERMFLAPAEIAPALRRWPGGADT